MKKSFQSEKKRLKKKLKILVACEFSGVVREAFRSKGQDVWSCDLLPAEDNSIYHYQRDVLEILYDGWDMLIAHPPCTYLANSGVHLLHKDKNRWQKMIDATMFFKQLLSAPIEKICVENPVMHKYALERIGVKYTQTIQPYQFGEDASKKTCLWLKNLPPLKPTNYIEPKYACACGYRFDYDLGKYGCPNCCGSSGVARMVWSNQTKGGQNKLSPSKDRWKLRSKTYQGIADAMANQWG